MMKQRLYHVDAVNDRAGTRERQTTHPMPHDAACTFVPKQSDGSKRAGVRFVLVEPPLHDRPTAAAPLKSYRYHGQYGWIMIGAKNDADALKEAARSFDHGATVANEDNLQRWNGYFYEPVN